MNKSYAVIILLVCYFGLLKSQNSIYPNFLGASLEEVKAKDGWTIINEAEGILNNDKINDVAIILESVDSIPEKRCDRCKAEYNHPRVLLVLLSNKKELKVSIQNNRFIARQNEGGMLPRLNPELEISGGLLIIGYEFTRGYAEYEFHCPDQECNIVSGKGAGVTAATGNFENTHFDFISNKLIITKGNISEDETQVREIPIDSPAKNLNDFKEMFEWEVVKDWYL